MKITLKIAIIMFMVACSNHNGQDGCAYFTQVGKGILSGSENLPQQYIVIKTPEEWENLRTAMNSVNEITSSFSETAIDFNKYQIVAVFGQVYTSGIWSITIECITEYVDKIVVAVVARNNDTGTSPQWITQPYHIVKIPVTEKKIEFE